MVDLEAPEQSKVLLNVKDLMRLTGLGEKSVRKLLSNPNADYVIKYGNRSYAHRDLFNKHLMMCAKNGLTL